MSQIYKSTTSGSVPSDVAIDFVTNNGTAVPVANVINVLGTTAYSAPATFTTGTGNTVSIEDRTWFTPYVVDLNTTVGQRGTYSTIQSAIDACFADGNATTNAKVGYIRIRGEGSSAPGRYIENLTFPVGSFYLEGDIPSERGNISTMIRGVHTIPSGAHVFSSNIFFDTGAVTVSFTFITGNTVEFYNCALNFSQSGGTSYFENCGLSAIPGTISGGTVIAFACDLPSAMIISGGAQTFVQCTNPQFTLSGTAAPICVDCMTTNNGGSWTGTTSGTPAVFGGQMASTYNYTGNIIVSDMSEWTAATNGDFFGANITQTLARTIQGNVIIRRTVAADATISNKDYYIGITSTAAARNMTLPNTGSSVTRPYKGQVFIFKDQSGAAGTNNITISPTGGTIDGAGTYVINTNFGFVEIMFDGTNYFITNKA